MEPTPFPNGEAYSIARESGFIDNMYLWQQLYSLTSLVRHSFIRHPQYYDNFGATKIFNSKLPSLYDYDTRQHDI